MPADNIEEQLVKYLTDLHSTEEHALTHLKTGVDKAGEPQLAAAFRDHLAETEEHERLITQRLEAHGADTSTLKDLASKGAATAAAVVTKSAPDTTGKLAISGFALEHLEIASYRMLRVVAEEAGDQETVKVAGQILAQEEAAADKVGSLLEQVAAYDLQQMGVTA